MTYKLTQESDPLNGDTKHYIWCDGTCLASFTNDEKQARKTYDKAVQSARDNKKIGERKTIQEDTI